MSSYRSNELTKGLGRATLVGGFGGTGILVIAGLAIEGFNFQAALILIPLVLFYGLFSLPFVGAGLVVFGLPVKALLRGREHRPWVPIMAILWGIIAAKVELIVLQETLFFGGSTDQIFDWRDPAPVWGALAGLGLWYFGRPEDCEVGGPVGGDQAASARSTYSG